MWKSANVTFLNGNGSVMSSLIVKDGDVNQLGKMLDNNYQNADKVIRLLQWGLIYRVGAQPKISPMMKTYGTEWEHNDVIQSILSNPKDEDDEYNMERLWKIIKTMDKNYTLPYTYLAGALKPLNSFNALDRVIPLPHNYVYDFRRSVDDKWLSCDIPGTNQEDSIPTSFSQHNKDGRLWKDLRSRIHDNKSVPQSI